MSRATRRTIPAILFVSGVLSAAAAHQQAPSDAKVIEVDKLRDNFFVLRGGGGNTAVFVQSRGVTIVDTKNPGWGQPLLDKIKELTSKPVATIINTHTHGDHVSGNVDFTAVEVVTHENTQTNMQRMPIFQKSEGKGLPRRVFKDRLTLGRGSDRIDLFYFGPGHTNGDAFVVFPSLRIMHAGDMFPGKTLPIMDANNGGSGGQYAGTLTKVYKGIRNVDTIVTGHSTQMTMADLREYSQFITDFVAAVREAQKAGQSVDQIAETWKVPEKYTGYTAPQANRLRGNIELILSENK